MNILIAPDKFKGSLTATEVCSIIQSAMISINPDLNIDTIALADGGEGTSLILTAHRKGSLKTTQVFDPLMRIINSTYGISRDGSTAFIEMALASGLQLLDPDERNCSLTTSYGTGQLIVDAIDKGVTEIVLGIGGSSTNDAGTGMAKALGYHFLSQEGHELDGIGANLIQIKSIDSSQLHAQLKETKVTVLCDVENPLYGPNGAAYVFAKQKGATEKDIVILDNGLQQFEILARSMGCDLNFAGAGAGGGLGAGAKLFLNAHIRSGIDFVIESTRLEEKIKHADLIITGEGKVDLQTLSGKVVRGVCEIAKRYDKKIIVVCGACELNDSQLNELGVAQTIALMEDEVTESGAIKNASKLLAEKVKHLATV